MSVPVGYVTGRFIRPLDETPENGRVTFVPLTPQHLTDARGPVGVTAPPIPVDVVDGAMPPTRLVAGQYDVLFGFPGSVYPGYRIAVTPEYTEGAPLDLALAAPPIPSPAVKFVLNEGMIADAERAASTATDAAVDASAYQASAWNARNEAATARDGATSARDIATEARATAVAARDRAIAEAARAAEFADDVQDATFRAAIDPNDPEVVIFRFAPYLLDATDDHVVLIPVRG